MARRYPPKRGQIEFYGFSADSVLCLWNAPSEYLLHGGKSNSMSVAEGPRVSRITFLDAYILTLQILGQLYALRYQSTKSIPTMTTSRAELASDCKTKPFTIASPPKSTVDAFAAATTTAVPHTLAALTTSLTAGNPEKSNSLHEIDGLHEHYTIGRGGTG